MSARGRGRGVVALAGMLLAWSPSASALNPALDISQYAHTAWKIRDGFPKGMVGAIAQTPDGYLWLGSEFGLFRFDGIASAAWNPPRGQRLPDNFMRSLLAARDGTLWIGTFKGLASWKDGKLNQYSELAEQDVYALLEDRKGAVWAGSLRPAQKVCAVRKGSIQCSAVDGGPDAGILALYGDGKGNLWAKTRNGVWQWTPGPPKFFASPGKVLASEGLAEADDGALLIGTSSGLLRLVDGRAEPYPLPGPGTNFQARRLLRDREGGVWIGTQDRGLLHAHQGRTDVFAQSEGLSGDSVIALFEDREGNIWVSTNNGLDRFRDFAIPTYSGNQGLSNGAVVAVLAAKDGNLWLSTLDGLKHWGNGQLTGYRKHAQRQHATGENEILGSGLPEEGIQSIFEDGRGRIWVATLDGVGYLENDHFTYIRGLRGGFVLSIAEDNGGNLWLANQNSGLFLLSRHGEIQEIPWARFGRDGFASTVLADPRQGGVWLGFFRGGVTYFQDGQIRASYTAADGLGNGWVKDLRLDPDGTLWAATQGGLSRLKNGRLLTLTSRNGLPCDAVHWMIDDDSGSSWLYMACGLVRVARSELDAWAADPNHTVGVTVFDSSDGVRLLAHTASFAPQVGKSPDGKLWFSPQDGVSVIDPRHLPFNNLPPPVHIEHLTANRKPYDDLTAGMHLPPLIRDLKIDYTAFSLAAPEKVKFRYKLEGHDPDWVDAGTRRQAFYNDLKPRRYRFRVTACNNSGVWNEAGAFLDFSIDPKFYQTTWFQAACAAAFLATLWGVYRVRLLYLTRQFNLRLEERVNERTRIARDLHDTILQSFQGLLLKLSALSYQIPERPDVQKNLEGIIQQTHQAVTEGRDAVQGLRSSTVATNQLAQSIQTLGQELAAEGSSCPELRVQVEGASRELSPIVRDEVYRIACEAVRNAFSHAEAARIEVAIQYGGRQFQLRVLDNGKGVDPNILADGARAGHHGLPGMRERAELAGGKLTLRSRPGAGTEIELTIPASFAYVKSGTTRASRAPGVG